MKKITRITIRAKCGDLCDTILFDKNNNVVFSNDGYVPDFIPNNFNDCIDLDIDVETGKILNWKTPTQEQFENFICEE